MFNFFKKSLSPAVYKNDMVKTALPWAQGRFLDLLIILDASQSMKDNDPQEMRKSAVINLINVLEPEDRIGIVEFANQASTLCKLTNNKAAAAAAVQKSTAKEEGTYIDKAIERGLKEMYQAPSANHRAIIIFTDGGGRYREDLNQKTRQAGIKIFTVGLGNKVKTALLQSIALKTGGKYLHASQAHELQEIFQRLSKTLRFMAENEGRLLLS